MSQRTWLTLGVVVLVVVAVLVGLRSVQAGKQVGLLGATQEAEEHLTQGTAPGKETPSPKPPRVEGVGEFPTLVAEHYRQEILDIDRLVFETEEFTETRRSALANKLRQLAARIKQASSTRFIEIESFELKRLAEYAVSAPQSVLENHWMRIRNNVFDDRSWFARSAEDLVSLPAEAKAADPFVPVAPSEGNTDRPLPSAPLPTTYQLEGQWRVHEIYGNGRLMTDPEMSKAVVTFAGDEIVIQPPAGSSSHYRFTTVADSRGTALRLESDRSNKGPAENGWMIYEFSERELKLAFYDGLGQRPDGFTVPADKKGPMLTVVILQRER